MQELRESDAIIAILDDDLSARQGLSSPVRSAYEYLRNKLLNANDYFAIRNRLDGARESEPLRWRAGRHRAKAAFEWHEWGAYRIASVAAWGSVFALDTSQYAHTSWKLRDGFANSSFTQLHRRPRVICGSAQKQACFGSMACGPSRGRGQPHRNCRAKTSRLGPSIVKFTCASYFRGKASEVVLQPKLNYAFSLAEAEVSGRGISSSRESNSRAPCITCIRTRLRRCRCLYIPRTYPPALGFNMYGPGEGRRVGIGLR